MAIAHFIHVKIGKKATQIMLLSGGTFLQIPLRSSEGSRIPRSGGMLTTEGIGINGRRNIRESSKANEKGEGF